MPRDYKVYLDDILLATDKVARYMANLSREAFAADEMRVDAVVRNLSVIGEAVKHLPVDLRSRHPEVDWQKISGLRDILVHEYFGIDLDIVWDLIRNKLPLLQRQIESILSE